MSIKNLLGPNIYKIYANKGIFTDEQVGGVTINDDGETTGTFTTADLYNALSGGGGGGGITGNLTPNYVPIASGLSTLIDSTIVDQGATLTFGKAINNMLIQPSTGDGAVFILNNTSSQTVFKVDSANNQVTTTYNTLDDGAGTIIASGGIYANGGNVGVSTSNDGNNNLYVYNNDISNNTFIANGLGLVASASNVLDDGTGLASFSGRLVYNSNNDSVASGYVAMEPVIKYEYISTFSSGIPASASINVPYPSGKGYTDLRGANCVAIVSSGLYQGTYVMNDSNLSGQVLFYVNGAVTNIFISTSSTWGVTSDPVTFFLWFETI
jgi:hypothetical protein